MTDPAPIRFVERKTGKIIIEKIYGENFLRFTYNNPLGRLALHALVKRAFFSKVYGHFMDRPNSCKKIAPFVTNFGLNETEFLEPISTYKSFNEFFFRKLTPEARPIQPGPEIAVFPADGRHLAFQTFGTSDGIFVKGQVFKLHELLQSNELAQRYNQGSLLISRLCPVDYHRFHFPVGGLASSPTLLNGSLQSVSPLALRQNIRILSTNRRWISMVDNPDFGKVTMVEVGATCVGSSIYTYPPGRIVSKGDEKGYFRFGGSLSMTLFEPGRIQLDADLLENTFNGLETYSKMGERCGELLRKASRNGGERSTDL